MKQEVLHYSALQRGTALAYGVLTHVAFLAAVALMAFSLFTGLRHGLGRATGISAWLWNAALLAQFPLVHSLLLSRKGRPLLSRLAPPSLRRELGSTVYALVASLQLLLVFGLWSPLPSFVWTPGRFGFCALSLLYISSWALLAQSMREAGLELHLGSLGWRAVWRNRPVAYPPMPSGPLHDRVRQPIYLSFALILWTAPVWSWDRVIFAAGWTAYCIGGALLKERRFARYFGAAFAAYQRSVPFMLPRRARSETPSTTDADVAIAGAGPVGLLLANLLARAGLRVAIVEKRVEPRAHSMAIGITPPSLDILRALGLDDAFQRTGVRIRGATVHEAGIPVGRLMFDGIEGEHPYILSLPQSHTEEILARALLSQPGISWQAGCEAIRVIHERTSARLVVRDGMSGNTSELRARDIVACDGAHSAWRTDARIGGRRQAYAPTVTMADFQDTTALGDAAQLYFVPERPVESFPLPGGIRRWILRTGWRGRADLIEPFEESIARLTGHHVPAAVCLRRSAFQPSRFIARRFFKQRLILCGDAAHGMSPIGGQGMNTGFADASQLAAALHAILIERESAHRVLAEYERQRRLAFGRAARRAELGMWLGTRTGRHASILRGALVARLLRHPAVHKELARWFSMRSLPQPLIPPNISTLPIR